MLLGAFITLIEGIKRMPSLRELMLYYRYLFNMRCIDMHVYQFKRNAIWMLFADIYLLTYCNDIEYTYSFIIPTSPLN